MCLSMPLTRAQTIPALSGRGENELPKLIVHRWHGCNK
jgi:hypothetical protein